MLPIVAVGCKRPVWLATACSGLVLFACLLLAAPASAIDLDQLSPPLMTKRIKATGWSVVSEPITAKEPGYRSWIWAVTRDVVGGAVGFYIYEKEEDARSLEMIMSGKDDAAVVRDGRFVVSVIVTGRPDDAKALLEKLMAPTADSPTTGKVPSTSSVARAALFGPPTRTEDGIGKSKLRAAAPLPDLRFGDLVRSEVLAAALDEGWLLSARPHVTTTKAYDAVTWTLTHDKKQASLSLYACHEAACSKDLARLTRGIRGADQAVRGDAVVVVVVADAPDAPRRAKSLVRAITRFGR